MTDLNKGLNAGRRMFAERNRPSSIHEPNPQAAEEERRPNGTVASGRALYEEKHPKGNR